MKIKGSLLQKVFLLIQVIFLISAIGMDIYMNVKNAYSSELNGISKGLLYAAIIIGCIIPFIQKEDDEIEE
jgi:TRAP-type C4-dicarboxylate transport system permease small subunit